MSGLADAGDAPSHHNPRVNSPALCEPSGANHFTPQSNCREARPGWHLPAIGYLLANTDDGPIRTRAVWANEECHRKVNRFA